MHLPASSLLAAAAVALAVAGAVAAQDAPATGTSPAEAPPAPAPGATPAPAPAPAPVSPAAPAGTAPAAPGAAADPAAPEVMEVVRGTFGDWEVRCAPAGNDCFMYQLARDAAENPVAEVSILKLPAAAEATAGVTVVTPLGTLLPPGLTVQVDGNQGRTYPFAWCSQVGCFVRFGLDEPAVASLKRGRGAKIAVASVGAPDRPIGLDVSLTGFTAAYDSLEVPPDPPAATSPAPAPAPAAPTIPPPVQ